MTSTPRIIVIDDNPSIHDDFRKILCPDAAPSMFDEMAASLFDSETKPKAAFDFELDSAYQGQEALAKVEQALTDVRPYALAFVDGRMPPGSAPAALSGPGAGLQGRLISLDQDAVPEQHKHHRELGEIEG